MYTIVVYDIEEKRVSKILKYLRGYLNWVQNSVFEGELTEGKFREMQIGIKKIMKAEKDSVLFYKFSSMQEVEKEVYGVERGNTDVIL